MASLSSTNALSPSTSSSASFDEYRRLQDEANKISISANKEKIRSIADSVKAIFPRKESPLVKRIEQERRLPANPAGVNTLHSELERRQEEIVMRTLAQNRRERFTVLRNQNPRIEFEVRTSRDI